MKTLLTALIINIVSASFIYGADFQNLRWGMSQQEVVSLYGKPFKETESKIVYGTLTQTYSYKHENKKSTNELLFQENLLTNVSYKISTDQKFSANYVKSKLSEITKKIEEIYGEPVSVENMDSSTKKIIYESDDTRVTVVYFNMPIKGDYINRTAYLNVNYSNKDIIVKAKLRSRKSDRLRDMRSRY